MLPNLILAGECTYDFANKVPLLEQEVDTGLVRSSRNRRNPARFKDYIPTSTVPVQVGQYLTKKQQLEVARVNADATQPECNPEPTSNEGSGEGDPSVAHQIITVPDNFGVFRKYSSLPSHNPDSVDPFSDLPSAPSGMASSSRPSATNSIGSNLTIPSVRSDPDPLSNLPSAPSGMAPSSRPSATSAIGSNSTAPSIGSDPDPLANSENPTVDLLLSWYSEGSTDGATNLDHLVNCLRDPHFDISQLKDFNAVSALRKFEKTRLHSGSGGALEPGDDWKCGSVTIRIPCVRHPQHEEDAPEFTVDGVYYRDAVEVITKELMDPDSFDNIHLKPFEEWWRPTEASEPVRVYSEIYTSDAMLQLEKELQETLKGTAGPQLETFILAALLYSDSTRLAQFGHASLWPVYMYIGNASKYIRARPNSFSALHIAYLPTVWIFPPGHLLHISQFTPSYRTQ